MFLGDLTRDQYLAAVAARFVGGHDPAEVVLMEIDPAHQKTLPDFVVTAELWGVRAVDVRSIAKRAAALLPARRQRHADRAHLQPRDSRRAARIRATLPFDYRDDLDVEWTGGPDWFFRISKFSIPWLRHPWVPQTQFLSDVGDCRPTATTGCSSRCSRSPAAASSSRRPTRHRGDPAAHARTTCCRTASTSRR